MSTPPGWSRPRDLFFLNTYSAVATPYNPSTPTPTTFLEFLGNLDSFDEAPYIFPLAGGAGSLAIHDFGMPVPSASLVAVPEPALAWMMGCCGTVPSPAAAAND